MHLALVNDSLPPTEHADWLPRLADHGIDGIEVVTSATWSDAWPGPRPGPVARYGQQLRRAGLAVVGLRTTLSEISGLTWFADATQRQVTLAHLAHLAAVCRDLGGTTLIIDGARWRGQGEVRAAWRTTLAFFQALLPRIEGSGVTVCLSPIAPDQGDFCRLAMECRILADAIDHPQFGLVIGAGALAQNGELGQHAVFASHYGRLESFTADEPGLAPFASSSQVDHPCLRRHLAAGGYRGSICLRQRPDARLLPPALDAFVACYQRLDNLAMIQHQQRQQGIHRPMPANTPGEPQHVR